MGFESSQNFNLCIMKSFQVDVLIITDHSQMLPLKVIITFLKKNISQWLLFPCPIIFLFSFFASNASQ